MSINKKNFLPAGEVVGKNGSLRTVAIFRPSHSQILIPSAYPAAFATPSAVVSGTVDRTKN